MHYLESLFDRALDAVVGMDATGRVIAWNGAAEQIFGWSRSEAIGTNMNELIVPPQHREGHTRGLERYNRTGEGPVLEKRVRITALHRDGTEFPVELSIFPMKSSSRARVFYAFISSRASEEAFRREQDLRAREADAVMKIGQKLIEDVSLEEFTRFCLDAVCEIADMDAGHLFVLRGQGANRVLVPSGFWHLKNDQLLPVVEETSRHHFGLGQGLPGRAWMSGELETIEDLSHECKFVRKKVFAEVGLTRGVALPVSHGGQIHAVLEFFGTAQSRLDPEMQRMLKTVGSQIGAAIRRKEGAESREILRREMMHRVSNSLSILSSIYRSCSRQAASKEELDKMFLNRVMAVGRANRMAIVEGGRGIALPDLIRDALAVLPDHEDITFDVAPVSICSGAVMPISLILNELATNSLKYGTLGSESTLLIKAGICDHVGELNLEWCELRHYPLDNCPAQPTRIGFGSQLMQAMIEGRLNGRFERRLDETGFHFSMRIPKHQLEAASELAWSPS
ncbi:PAS domain S-box protein [Limimaricola soesokkakensis]|uniref:PAS domain S-box protein n=1 Tax=Limimaricola soesokkakensis TaxID=1343159 RepID=UPI0035155CC2